MAKTEFENLEALRAAEGKHLGYSEWMEMTQDRVNNFAEATDDHQWIHVDVERAKHGPFGGPIAHGFLTLSLLSRFSPELVHVKNVKAGINYGFDKVRFISPVPVGSRIRMGSELISVKDVPGGVQITAKCTIEIEGNEKPACVAEWITRYLA